MAGAEARWVQISALLRWLFRTRTGSNGLTGDERGKKELWLKELWLSANDDSLGQWIKAIWIFHKTSLQVRESSQENRRRFGREVDTGPKRGVVDCLPAHKFLSYKHRHYTEGKSRRSLDSARTIICQCSLLQNINRLCCCYCVTQGGWVVRFF